MVHCRSGDRDDPVSSYESAGPSWKVSGPIASWTLDLSGPPQSQTRLGTCQQNRQTLTLFHDYTLPTQNPKQGEDRPPEGTFGLTMTVAISSEFGCLRNSRIDRYQRLGRTARLQRQHIAWAYNPAWGSVPSDNSAPLHGVLHSSQLPPTLADTVGVYDARDAIEACSGLYGEEKAACFAIFGVDGEAERWYEVVFQLETALELETGKYTSFVLLLNLMEAGSPF